MRSLSLPLGLILLAVPCAGFASPPRVAGDASSPYSFEVQKVVEGVYVAVRQEPPGLMFNGNSVFIVNDEDVVVVDTTITPSSAREVLAALRKITDKPVRYVINTHFHDDHVVGNQVFREAYPGVEFIAHTTAREDLTTVGVTNRKGLQDGAPGFVEQIRAVMAKKENLTGAPLTEEERASFTSDIAQVERYLAEAPGFQIVLPTVEVEDRLTLRRGERTIEIRHLGRAHSRGDLAVYLPKEKVAITGDLVVWPVPLVGTTSFPLDYAATLERLLALQPAVIVPGHGPVMRDDSYVRLMVGMLGSIKEQTNAAVARGETLEQARKSVNLDEFRKAIAGDSQLKSFIFSFYVAGPAVAAAYRQATERSR
jgi:glyoxylase-like metal-dependent hydrolase (beta-lactamase superfamily II)